MSDSVHPQRRQPTRLPRPWDSPGKNTGVGCHFLLQCMKVKSEREVAQSCPTPSDPMDCSPPGSSIHGIFQARVLEWGAIAFSKILCNNLMVPRGKDGGRDSQGVWDGHGHTALFIMENQQGPAVQHSPDTGTLLSVMWQPGWEGSLGENGHVFVWLSPFTVHLKPSQHF